MSELVLLHHNEPMTTSLAIAEGVKLPHKTVIQLVRKYVADLSDLGEVAFQTRLMQVSDGTSAFEMRKSNHRPTEFAWLNEGQAMFLMTLMRNSEIVVAFKKALVKAFLELRDRVKAIPPAFTTTNLAHGADLAVASDRTFRGFLRSARASGLRLPQALQVANRQTIARTGMDMLHELGVVPVMESTVTGKPEDSIDRFVAAWQRGETRYPCTMCRNADLFAAYRQWCAALEERSMPDSDFHRRIGKYDGMEKIITHIGRESIRVVLPTGVEQGDGESKGDWVARCMAEFRASLD